MAPHHVPGHWCLAALSWAARRGVYSDSAAVRSAYAQRGVGGLAEFARGVIRAQARAPPPQDPRSFHDTRERGRQQPDGFNCGICVLLELEALCDDLDLFFAAAGCARREQRAPVDLDRARARFACQLLTAIDDEDLALARRRAANAIAEVIDLT